MLFRTKVTLFCGLIFALYSSIVRADVRRIEISTLEALVAKYFAPGTGTTSLDYHQHDVRVNVFDSLSGLLCKPHYKAECRAAFMRQTERLAMRGLPSAVASKTAQILEEYQQNTISVNSFAQHPNYKDLRSYFAARKVKLDFTRVGISILRGAHFSKSRASMVGEMFSIKLQPVFVDVTLDDIGPALLGDPDAGYAFTDVAREFKTFPLRILLWSPKYFEEVAVAAFGYPLLAGVSEKVLMSSDLYERVVAHELRHVADYVSGSKDIAVPIWLRKELRLERSVVEKQLAERESALRKSSAFDAYWVQTYGDHLPPLLFKQYFDEIIGRDLAATLEYRSRTEEQRAFVEEARYLRWSTMGRVDFAGFIETQGYPVQGNWQCVDAEGVVTKLISERKPFDIQTDILIPSESCAYWREVWQAAQK